MALLFGRNEQPAVGHQTQQAEGFEGGGLSARVGTADNQAQLVLGDVQVDRHDRLTRGQQQRMAGPGQTKRRAAKAWFGSALLAGQHDLGVQHINLGQGVEEMLQLGQLLADQPGQPG